MSQRPTLDAFRQDIQSVLGEACFTPPVEKIAEDFWNYWSALEAAIAEGSVSLSIDTFRLGTKYKRYSAWKGAAKIIFLLAIVIIWFQWGVGVIVGPLQKRQDRN